MVEFNMESLSNALTICDLNPLQMVGIIVENEQYADALRRALGHEAERGRIRNAASSNNGIQFSNGSTIWIFSAKSMSLRKHHFTDILYDESVYRNYGEPFIRLLHHLELGHPKLSDDLVEDKEAVDDFLSSFVVH